MYSAASGLMAHAEAISVASDNIANVNTIGFKAQRARFEDILGSTVAGAVENQASGQGVRLGGVHSLFTQGSLIGSNLNTDMAIQGDGFFVMQGAFDGQQNGRFYSRDGQFNIDNDGFMVNGAGLRVMGYSADQDENLSSTLSTLEVPLTQIVPPKASTLVNLGANLSPENNESFIVSTATSQIQFGTGGTLAPQGTDIPGGFDGTTVTTAEASSHYSSNVTIYDQAEGEAGPQAHDATIWFTQTGNDTWTWRATVPSNEMGADATDPATARGDGTEQIVIAGGALSFDNTTGALTAGSQDAGLNDFLFLNTDDPTVVDFDFANSNISQASGVSGITPTGNGSLGFQSETPETTSHFSTSVIVYDTLGVGHNVNVFFNQTSTGNWSWHALADGAEMADPTDTTQTREGENVVLANGTVTFDENGRLMTESQTTKTFHFFNTNGTQQINFDFGQNATSTDNGGDGGTGLGGLTQFDQASSVSEILQDGYASGALAGIKVQLDGKITGTFTNGERRVLAAVALARFVNNDGLIRRDNGHYTESPDSGQALVGQAGTGGRGSIVGNNLEQSTVELANEFVNVITYQRGFQANSRSITTADQLLQEAVNLKR
jgi:flagellar hook protein FlgE